MADRYHQQTWGIDEPDWLYNNAITDEIYWV